MWIKVCGITNQADAKMVVEAGANALGLNLIPRSKRAITREQAKAIAASVQRLVEVICVVEDLRREDVEALHEELGTGVQLHGQEPPELLEGLTSWAYKAVAISEPQDVDQAARFPGERLLVDTKTPGAFGGSGETFDWTLVEPLARTRQLIVAGGLHSDNVAEAVRLLSPYGVDVASGVEVPGDPRRKDPARVRAFIRAARQAG